MSRVAKNSIKIPTDTSCKYENSILIANGKLGEMYLTINPLFDIDFEVPKEVKVECPKQNIIKLSSSNKEVLGAVAANIRSFRKPEPFKGKGIKYENEFIFRKEGKKK